MELRALRYFVQIAELRSITKAARQLYIAQPSLTRQMHNLEEELGTALFVRLSRGVTLTEAGELLLDHATRVLHDVDRMRTALVEQGTQPAGPVLLGLPPTLGPVVLPPLLMRLRSLYPKINLEVVPSRNITLADWLLTGRVDVAILAQAEVIPELQISEVAREEMVLLTGPTARPQGIVDAKELAALPLAGTTSLLAITNDLLKPHGVRLRVDFTLNNLDAIREMVQQSMCCAIFPYAFIRRDHKGGLVSAHRILSGGLHRRLAIGVPTDRPRTAAMNAVIQLCREVVAEADARGDLLLPVV
jgi:LysR family transcriptional regulator, nitrogen assimilation regulatory protein